MTHTRGNLFDVLNASPGEIAGVEVYIVGTAHISAQSAADVEENRNGPGIVKIQKLLRII